MARDRSVYRCQECGLAAPKPGTCPDCARVGTFVQLVEERGVTTIYYETLVSPRIAETVARETGANVAVLDPIEGLSEERLAHGEDYLTVMRDNLATLRRALACR